MNHMTPPGPHPAPAVKHGHPAHAVGNTSFHIFIQLTELITDRFHIIHKIRKIHGQFQITAITDPIHRFAENRPAGRHPVYLRLFHRISPLIKGIREKIGQQPSFCIRHPLNIADQPKRSAVSHTSHHRIQSDTRKFLQKRLRSDPVISQEHHRLLAEGMGNIHHLFYDFHHFPVLESQKILIFFRRYPVLVIVISLINDIFRTEGIPNLPLKLFQNMGTHGRGISIPVHIFFPKLLIKNKRKLMKEGGEP